MKNCSRVRAVWLGVKDGLRQPYELTSGITWDDYQDLNLAYDKGANLGQKIGRLIFKTQRN